MPTVIAMKRWVSWIGVLALALLAATEGWGAAELRPTQLVLSAKDVGGPYVPNRSMTLSWTLRERTDGFPQPLRRELAAKWVAGAQAGFDGSDAVAHQAILSTADLFRTSDVSRIVESWQGMFLRYGRGTRLRIPASAPAGASRFLMRGRMLSHGTKLEVILYLWRHDRAVLSVWLIGKPGIPRLPHLMVLASRQDSKLARARR